MTTPSNPDADSSLLPWQGATQTRLPRGSRIEVFTDADDRLVVYLAAGRSFGGVGCFAFAFLLLMLPVLVVVVFQAIQGNLRFQLNWQDLLKASKAIAFCFGGLLFVVVALRSRFERTILFLDSESAYLQRTLFGWKRIESILLSPSSHADLEEAQNFKDLVIYRVIIAGLDRQLTFAEGLLHSEKEWLVDCVNQHLAQHVGDVEDSASIDVVDSANQRLSDAASRNRLRRRLPLVVPLRPEQLPAQTRIRMESADPDNLRFSFAAVTDRTTRFLLPICMVPPGLIFVVFSLIALVVAALKPNEPQSLGALLAAVAAMFAGLPPILLSSYILIGRNSVELTQEKLSCRWHLGPLGFSRSLPTSSVTAVTFEFGVAFPRDPRATNPEPLPFTTHGRTCVAHGDGRRLFLSILQPTEISRQVAGLLICRLHELGVPVATEPPAQ